MSPEDERNGEKSRLNRIEVQEFKELGLTPDQIDEVIQQVPSKLWNVYKIIRQDRPSNTHENILGLIIQEEVTLVVIKKSSRRSKPK